MEKKRKGQGWKWKPNLKCQREHLISGIHVMCLHHSSQGWREQEPGFQSGGWVVTLPNLTWWQNVPQTGSGIRSWNDKCPQHDRLKRTWWLDKAEKRQRSVWWQPGFWHWGLGRWWYYLFIKVSNTGSRAVLRAKVWSSLSVTLSKFRRDDTHLELRVWLKWEIQMWNPWYLGDN